MTNFDQRRVGSFAEGQARPATLQWPFIGSFGDIDYGHGTHYPSARTGTFGDIDYGRGTRRPFVRTGSFGDVER